MYRTGFRGDLESGAGRVLHPGAVMLAVGLLGACDQDVVACYERSYHDPHEHRYELVSVTVDGDASSSSDFAAQQVELWASGALTLIQYTYDADITNDLIYYRLEGDNVPAVATANLAEGGE